MATQTITSIENGEFTITLDYSEEGWIPRKECPRHRSVIVNDRTTVVLWDDETKTKATCSTADEFDVVIGFAMCLAKKLYGKKKLARMAKKAVRQT